MSTTSTGGRACWQPPAAGRLAKSRRRSHRFPGRHLASGSPTRTKPSGRTGRTLWLRADKGVAHHLHGCRRPRGRWHRHLGRRGGPRIISGDPGVLAGAFTEAQCCRSFPKDAGAAFGDAALLSLVSNP
jgi:hypothetical protein